MESPPKWFVDELQIIDPTYFVVANEDYQYYEIKKKMDIDRVDKENGKHVRVHNPTVAVFHTLNDDALLSIRRRKYIGLQYRQDTMAYLKDIQKQNREAKAKAKQIAREMMAEGYMRIYNLGRKRYYLTPSGQKEG